MWVRVALTAAFSANCNEEDRRQEPLDCTAALCAVASFAWFRE